MPSVTETTALSSPSRTTRPFGWERTDLIGTRASVVEIAHAFGCCERTVRNVIDRANIPYVKVFGQRYIDIDAFRAAVAATEVGRPPRGRGRPRKAA